MRKSTRASSSLFISSLAALAASAAAALLVSCAGNAVPQPTAKSVEFAERNGQNTSLASLKHGRTLYVGRCSACHALHQPREFKAESWPQIVQGMASNAQLNVDQERDVTAYLVAVSAQALDTAQAPPPSRPGPSAPSPYP
jgi:hypothetical protein